MRAAGETVCRRPRSPLITKLAPEGSPLLWRARADCSSGQGCIALASYGTSCGPGDTLCGWVEVRWGWRGMIRGARSGRGGSGRSQSCDPRFAVGATGVGHDLYARNASHPASASSCSRDHALF